MEGARLKRGAEQQLSLVQVAKELERVRVGGVLPQDRARLEHKLVRAEVLALKKHELVLVGEVQRPHYVLQDAEVEGLDALCACVTSIVRDREELGTAEAGLAIEDGLVADEDFGRLGLAVEVELALC